MVSLEAALDSVRLSSYITNLTEKGFSLESLCELDSEELDILVRELDMKKGHSIRLRSLLDSLRPIMQTIDPPRPPSPPPKNTLKANIPKYAEAALNTIQRPAGKKETDPSPYAMVPNLSTRTGERDKAMKAVQTVEQTDPGHRSTLTESVQPSDDEAIQVSVQVLKQELSSFLSNKHEVFQVMQAINKIDIEVYENALKDLASLKQVAQTLLEETNL